MISRAAALLVALALGILPTAVPAAMSVSRAVIPFLPGQPPRQDIIVSNPDAETLYVKAEVFTVAAPGTPEEKREKVTDPEKIGLLVTPNKFVIPAGQQKVVRLVNLQGNTEAERIYRVVLTPVVGEIESNAPMVVKVVVAYDTLVIVEPAKPAPALSVVREGKRATFTNTGNVYAYVHSGEQCAPAPLADATCQELPNKRIYPGGTWTMELPFDGSFEVIVESLQQHAKRRID